ncbi:hypothetical protein XGA_0301 [Xanthomonas hortorum ATCC 19865]|nr:hypothetical protein XGA_0301 [Xanthomonas hortorum ATCC 19865]
MQQRRASASSAGDGCCAGRRQRGWFEWRLCLIRVLAVLMPEPEPEHEQQTQMQTPMKMQFQAQMRSAMQLQMYLLLHSKKPTDPQLSTHL